MTGADVTYDHAPDGFAEDKGRCIAGVELDGDNPCSVCGAEPWQKCQGKPAPSPSDDG